MGPGLEVAVQPIGGLKNILPEGYHQLSKESTSSTRNSCRNFHGVPVVRLILDLMLNKFAQGNIFNCFRIRSLLGGGSTGWSCRCLNTT